MDNDGDQDVLYLASNHLYIKYNHTNTADKSYVTDDPLEIDIDDNKYYNGDIFYEVIDHFEEDVISSNAINISFDRHANPDISKYRLEFDSFIDLDVLYDDLIFADLDPEVSQPLARDKNIVDIIADADVLTFENRLEPSEQNNI
jgi:hypothetical protein